MFHLTYGQPISWLPSFINQSVTRHLVVIWCVGAFIGATVVCWGTNNWGVRSHRTEAGPMRWRVTHRKRNIWADRIWGWLFSSVGGAGAPAVQLAVVLPVPIVGSIPSPGMICCISTNPQIKHWFFRHSNEFQWQNWLFYSSLMPILRIGIGINTSLLLTDYHLMEIPFQFYQWGRVCTTLYLSGSSAFDFKKNMWYEEWTDGKLASNFKEMTSKMFSFKWGGMIMWKQSKNPQVTKDPASLSWFPLL